MSLGRHSLQQFKNQIINFVLIMKKLKHILIALFALLSLNLVAQNEANGHPILDSYDVFEISGKVFINVTVSSGNTCRGISVLRSSDSITYESIGHVPGTCGSTVRSVSYSFTDPNPIKNRKLFYKVELGSVGYTNAVAITIIDTEEFGYQVRPNPANNEARVYFENPHNDEFELSLYNLSGIQVLNQTSNNNEFQLTCSNLPAGMYVFRLGKSFDQKQVIGKIIIQH